MNSLDYNAVLKDLQYKPNFGYAAYERDDGWWIRIIMLVENARMPWRRWKLDSMPQEDLWYGNRSLGPALSSGIGYSPSRLMVEVVGNYAIPPYKPGDEDAFVSWMIDTFKSMEEHETFEWLRYKGELINDPHKEMSA